jgi:hypothetical protein
MHTLLDLRGPIPSFIRISDGKMGDAAALDLIMPEAGAIYVQWRENRHLGTRIAVFDIGARSAANRGQSNSPRDWPDTRRDSSRE